MSDKEKYQKDLDRAKENIIALQEFYNYIVEYQEKISQISTWTQYFNVGHWVNNPYGGYAMDLSKEINNLNEYITYMNEYITELETLIKTGNTNDANVNKYSWLTTALSTTKSVATKNADELNASELNKEPERISMR